MKTLTIALLTLLITSCRTASTLPDFSWTAGDGQHDLTWAENVGAQTKPGNKVWEVSTEATDPTGQHPSGKAIQAAIDECAAQGGGKVVLQPGQYLTGALFIKNGVELHIGEGVTLIASEDMADYPESRTRIAGIEMVWPAAVLNVVGQKNAAITGSGKIDCRGESCWNKYWEMRRQYEQDSLRWIVDYDCKRIRGILISESEDITLEGITIERTGFWAVQVLYSTHCTVNGITIHNNLNGQGPSTDGIDIDSSTRILVENCDIDCNDDNICLKAGRDADGLRVNRPTEYVVIRNCTSHKGAGLVTCGSETSGSIRNILCYNLKAKGTSNVLRLKSAMNRGGIVENIYLAGVEADSVGNIIAADLNWNPSYSYSRLPVKYAGTTVPEHWTVMLTPVEPKEKGYPLFRHIYVSGIQANGARQFITASGGSDSLRLEDFQLNDIRASVAKAGRIRLSDQFVLQNIHLESNGDTIRLDNNNQLIMNNVSYTETKR